MRRVAQALAGKPPEKNSGGLLDTAFDIARIPSP